MPPPVPHIVNLVQDITRESGIACKLLSDNKTLRLQKGDAVRYIYGFEFDLNSAATQLIAKDKGTLSAALAAFQIPVVEHVNIANPFLTASIEDDQRAWEILDAYLTEHPNGVVCKPTFGSGGASIYLARTKSETNAIVHRLFSGFSSISLAPYYNIEREYRFILFRNDCVLAYEKKRPWVVGDGRSTIGELLHQQTQESPAPHKTYWDPYMAQIPKEGERWLGSWKHNLQQGADVHILNPAAVAEHLHIAQEAARAVNLQFGSVDVTEIADSAPSLRILEINSGVMMEKLIDLLPEGHIYARAIYKKAVHAMFE